MINTLYFFLALILAISFLVMLGQKLNISYPIFLVLGGLAISFIPGLPHVEVDPDLVFLIFLPPLLYEAAWNTSWKEFWRWRRVISMFAFGLVLITSSVVAFASWAIIPGFTLALGFLLGAIISPPDAVAAQTVLKGVALPKRMIHLLEGESLMNDASSLIIFRVALAAVITSSFKIGDAALDFVIVTALGILVGIAIGMVFYAIYRWLPTTSHIDVALSFAAPYLMYLAAEHFHVSGVLSVVSGGLFLSYHSHKFFNHASRLQGVSIWSALVFILNGFVFMLIGLELPTIVDGLGEYSLNGALTFALIISAFVIVTRMVVALATALFTRFISRYITTADSNPGWRGPLVIGWAGMRGVVSLASALSIPLFLPGGEAFPFRNLILFITFVVILITLVIQGLTLPLVIKWVNIRDTFPQKPEHEQEAEIRLSMLNTIISALDEKYTHLMEHNELLRDKRKQLDQHLLSFTSITEAEPREETDPRSVATFKKVSLELIALQRETLNLFRDKKEFDDDVIRKIEEQLDLDEAKIA
jgi:CPA1 family monovalent cation:H+ antiporter